MKPDRVEVLNCMEAEGGHFVRNLARAWVYADMANNELLMRAFPHIYEEYEQRVIRRQPVPKGWDQIEGGGSSPTHGFEDSE